MSQERNYAPKLKRISKRRLLENTYNMPTPILQGNVLLTVFGLQKGQYIADLGSARNPA
jgi:hypothetical protein